MAIAIWAEVVSAVLGSMVSELVMSFAKKYRYAPRIAFNCDMFCLAPQTPAVQRSFLRVAR
jgi:hypothetical protein